MSTALIDTAATENVSVTQKIKDSSLKASGWAYIIGDGALVAAGILEKQYNTALTGALYGTAGVVLARYGNPKAEKRLQILSQDLADYLQNQGVEIPKGTDIDAARLAKKGGIIESIERFLLLHPSEVFNAIVGCAGVQLLQGGKKQNRPWKTASGALVIGGALAGLLIPERKIYDKPKAEEGMLEKAWHWVQEKPLRVTGSLYMANNVTLTIDALKNPKAGGHFFQLLTVASYVIANSLIAMSDKNNTGSKNKDRSVEKLEEAAGQVVSAQPKEVQQKLIKQIAEYLSNTGRVGISTTELIRAIEDKIDTQTRNHQQKLWVKSLKQTNYAVPSL